MERVRTIITEDTKRHYLLLNPQPVEESSDFVRFKDEGGLAYKFYLDLERIQPSEQDTTNDLTMINIGMYRSSPLGIIRTKRLEEFAHRTLVGYLEDIFRRQEPQILFDDYPNREPEELIEAIIDENQGIAVRNETRLTAITALRIGTFLGTLIASLIFIIIGNSDYKIAGYGILSLLAIYIIADLPNRITTSRTRAKQIQQAEVKS